MSEQFTALAAAEGLHLFSLRPGTKVPDVRDWEHAARLPETTIDSFVASAIARNGGVRCGSRMLTEAQYLEWMRPYRDSGIACGPSGLVIIDLDTAPDGAPDGVEGLGRVAGELRQEIPDTRLMRTRSGGWQLYFRAVPGREIRNSVGLIAPHVDVRGCGGYVVAPGAYVGPDDRKPGGWYVIADPRPLVPLPDWLADLAAPPRPVKAERPTQQDGSSRAPRGEWQGRSGKSLRARLTGLLSQVAEAEPGTRNNRLHWAACRAAEMAADGDIDRDRAMRAVEEAAVLAGLSHVEARSTVTSAFRRPR